MRPEELPTVWSRNKKLKYGYTTGSCAAAAAKAALSMLLLGHRETQVTIGLPEEGELTLPVEHIQIAEGQVSCAVRKDGGDDPDVTTGLYIHATVRLCAEGTIQINGGEGVGIVTRPGLACAVGQPAINPVPRRMITLEAERLLSQYSSGNGARITIWVPGGEEIAKKTFNPRLGIVGGISILGTTGLVKPMSREALLDTIRLEIGQHAARSDRLILAPGNYGQDFARQALGIPARAIVLCSNYLGEALDMATELGIRELLLIGHAGKLVKAAAGIMDTHSRNADARAEVLAANAALCGADLFTVRRLAESGTTDEAFDILKKGGLQEQVAARLVDKIEFYTKKRTDGKIRVDVVLFTNQHGLLGQSDRVRRGLWKEYCMESVSGPEIRSF